MKKVRISLSLFIVLLVLSGLTAFPLRSEMSFIMNHLDWWPSFALPWLHEVNVALSHTPDTVLYGTDWLAFAHLVIAMFFIPVYINPPQHKVNLLVGMAACLAVFPLAFICGPIRGIPFFHQLIDCAFGAGGIILLLYTYKSIQHFETKSV